MNLIEFTELINNLGFPVVACGALFWSNRKTVNHYEKILLEFKQSIDANTQVINRLLSKE